MLETKEDEDKNKTSQEENDMSCLGLPPVDQSEPMNVVPTLVRYNCLVPIRFQSYRNKNWHDMLPKEIDSIIIERPWLFDQNVTFQK